MYRDATTTQPVPPLPAAPDWEMPWYRIVENLPQDFFEVTNLPATYKLTADHELATERDPLHADAVIGNLPTLTANHDLPGLIALWESLAVHCADCASFDRVDGVAAMRDLGIIASSVRSLGVEPAGQLPRFDQLMLALGEIAQTVPRDTNFTYLIANPKGERLRRLIQLDEEIIFVETIRYGMDHIDACTKKLYLSNRYELDDPQFEVLLHAAAQDLKQMVEAMVEVKLKISPQFFTTHLRPFFEPFQVGNMTLLAPGGAQMSLILVDQLLWGSDCDAAWYAMYWDENLAYTPVALKTFGKLVHGNMSMTTRATQYAQRRHEPQVRAAITAIEAIYNRLIAFRVPHLVVAKANFALRKESDVGSGGYQPTMLEHLIEQTKKSRAVIKTLLDTAHA